MSNNRLKRLWETLKKLRTRGEVKPGQDQRSIIRTIDDITIAVTEGLDRTREIQIKAWNPSLARWLFWDIRSGLESPEKADEHYKAAFAAVVAESALTKEIQVE